VVARSTTLGSHDLPRIARRAERPGTVVFDAVELEDGSRGRAVGLLFHPPPPAPPRDRPFPRRPSGDPPPFELVVARGTRDLEGLLAHLRWLLALTWISSVAGLAAILSWVVHRSLRPVDDLRGQIEAMDEDNLDRRFSVERAPAELAPVIDQLNSLLERIREAFEREQGFSSDAAHELRTPIAGLRSTLEVALERSRPAEEHREAERECLKIVEEMQATVESLLEMARMGVRTSAGKETTFRLADLVDECRASLEEEAARRGLRWIRGGEAEAVVRTDRRLLGRILSNVFDNAVAHADDGGTIEIGASVEGETLRMTVTNPASDAPPDVAKKAFDALWRGDASRTEVGRHAGLGLSICKRIARLLDAEIEASYVDGRFTVTIRGLPAEPDPGEGRETSSTFPPNRE
jgi:signal transduction histidine kinase